MTTKALKKMGRMIANYIRTGGRLAFYTISAIGLLFVVFVSASGQQSQVLSNDTRALVTLLELSPGKPFVVPNNQSGSVWVSLDSLVVVTKKDGIRNERRVPAGKAETIVSGEYLAFEIATNSHARLIVVKPKIPHQELTIGPFLQNRNLEDASDRNETLLIAISESHFRDTRNVGDESEWKPGKPDIVTMRAGSVRWIRSGIHHFKNLSPDSAKMIAIEW